MMSSRLLKSYRGRVQSVVGIGPIGFRRRFGIDMGQRGVGGLGLGV